MKERFSPVFVWLFALVAVAGSIGLATLTAPHGYKITAAVAFGFVGSLACLAALTTRASRLQAIGPFVVAALGIGAVYFVVARRVLVGAGSAIGASSSVGSGVAGFLAAIVLLDALAAGIGGALFGLKLRKVKSFGDLLGRPG